MVGLKRAGMAIVITLWAAVPLWAQVDLEGGWAARQHEDGPERGGGPDVGEYQGLPINDAARTRGDSWSASLWTVPEHQCIPHPADYGPNFSPVRISKDLDPVTREVIAYHTEMGWMEPERTIWMDGRPHPPEYAPHTWQGFSTGRWEGTTLVITTTHLKEGFIQRDGLAFSDRTTMTEYVIRHGNYLTANLYVDDPVWLAEPLMRSSAWVLDDTLGPVMQQRYPCGPNEIVVEVVRPKGEVPHHQPGTNDMLREF